MGDVRQPDDPADLTRTARSWSTAPRRTSRPGAPPSRWATVSGPTTSARSSRTAANAVGVMMSEHRATDTDSAFHFFAHPDAKTDTDLGGRSIHHGRALFAEDHINLKLTATSGGQHPRRAEDERRSEPHPALLARHQWHMDRPRRGWQRPGRHPTAGRRRRDEQPRLCLLHVAGDHGTRRPGHLLQVGAAEHPGLQRSGSGNRLHRRRRPGHQRCLDREARRHGGERPAGHRQRRYEQSYYHGFLSLGESSDHPFTDIAGTPFEDDIVWLWEEGITTGCTATKFCPKDPVTRGQMATFLARALDLPPASGDHFTDDNGTAHEDNINRLFEAGITTGCTATKFCPKDPVTRGQMSTFLDRGYDLPDATMTSSPMTTARPTRLRSTRLPKPASSPAAVRTRSARMAS